MDFPTFCKELQKKSKKGKSFLGASTDAKSHFNICSILKEYMAINNSSNDGIKIENQPALFNPVRLLLEIQYENIISEKLIEIFLKIENLLPKSLPSDIAKKLYMLDEAIKRLGYEFILSGKKFGFNENIAHVSKLSDILDCVDPAGIYILRDNLDLNKEKSIERVIDVFNRQRKKVVIKSMKCRDKKEDHSKEKKECNLFVTKYNEINSNYKGKVDALLWDLGMTVNNYSDEYKRYIFTIMSDIGEDGKGEIKLYTPTFFDAYSGSSFNYFVPKKGDEKDEDKGHWGETFSLNPGSSKKRLLEAVTSQIDGKSIGLNIEYYGKITTPLSKDSRIRSKKELFLELDRLLNG